MFDNKTEYLFNKSREKYDFLPHLKKEIGEIRYHNKKIISIEGVNGTGKTTQSNLVADYFKKAIYCVPKYIGFHGEGAVYKSVIDGNGIVGGPINQTLLFLACETAKEFYISNHCVVEDFVLYDRYVDSLSLCQRYEFLKSGYDLLEIDDWLDNLSVFLPTPDLTIILDAHPEICIKRTYQRKNVEGREICEQQLEEIINLRESFINICSNKKRNILLVNADKDIDVVSKEIINIISDFIGF